MAGDFKVKVAGVAPVNQEARLRRALDEIKKIFPGAGVTLFVFDYGERGGMLYGSTAARGDMVKAIQEWIDTQIKPKQS